MFNAAALVQGLAAYKSAVECATARLDPILHIRPRELVVLIAQYIGAAHGATAIDALTFGSPFDFGLVIASIVQYVALVKDPNESGELRPYDQMVRNFADFVPYELGDPTPIAHLDLTARPKIRRLCSAVRISTAQVRSVAHRAVSDPADADATAARVALFYETMVALYAPEPPLFAAG